MKQKITIITITLVTLIGSISPITTYAADQLPISGPVESSDADDTIDEVPLPDTGEPVVMSTVDEQSQSDSQQPDPQASTEPVPPTATTVSAPVEAPQFAVIINTDVSSTVLGSNCTVSLEIINNDIIPFDSGELRISLPPFVEYIDNPDYEYLPRVNAEELVFSQLGELQSGKTLGIKFDAKLPGTDLNFGIGDIIELEYNFSDNQGNSASGTHQIELAASKINVETENVDLLVSSPTTTKIELQQNPDQPNATNDSTVRVELEPGVEYIDQTQQVSTPDAYTGEVIFNIIPGLELTNTILEWVFTEIIPVEAYKNPVEIIFDTIFPTSLGNRTAIPHDQTSNILASFSAEYVDGGELVRVTSEDSQELTAKYFTAETKTDRSTYQVGDRIEYTKTITTSSAYKLNDIELTDTLPDGVDFLEISKSPTGSVELVRNTKSDTGDTTLTWRVVGMESDSQLSFSYLAEISELYTSGQNLSAGEKLASNNNSEGLASRSGTGDYVENTGTHTVKLSEYSINSRLVLPDGGHTSSIEARIGDQIPVLTEIKFPESQPTQDFQLELFIPSGTELVGDINTSTAVDLQQRNPNHYLVELEQVPADYRLNLNYTLEVLDKHHLKSGTQLLHNTITQGTNLQRRSQNLTINIVNPWVTSNPEYTGYLAAGEEIDISLFIQNVGTSPAHKVTATSYIPTQLNDIEIKDLPFGVEYNSGSRSFSVKADLLEPGKPIVIKYSATVNSEVEAGDKIVNRTDVHRFRNRADTESAYARVFTPRPRYADWWGQEPLLVTGFAEDKSAELVIGRDDTKTIRYYVTNVGNAPAYNVTGEVDFKVTTDDLTITPVNSSTGVKQAVLYPGESMHIDLKAITKSTAKFGNAAAIAGHATGTKATSAIIAKDGSRRLTADIDNDDANQVDISIAKLDLVKPDAEIFLGEDLDNQYWATNDDTGQLNYTAGDSDSRVIGWQVSTDGSNWTSPTNSNLTSVQLQALDIEGPWSVWSGDTNEIVKFDTQGRHHYYLRVVDLYGNIGEASTQLIYDHLAPSIEFKQLSPWSDTNYSSGYTGNLDNFLHLIATDDASETSEVSMTSAVRFSTDNSSYSEWIQVEDNRLETVPVNFDIQLQELDLLIQVRDYAGNVSNPEQTSISFTDESPEISINLQNGAKYTNRSIVNLGLEIEDSTAGSWRARFGPSAAALASSNWLVFDPAINDTYLLPQSWKDGQKQLCMQVQDRAAANSNITCDQIILDTTPPTGHITLQQDGNIDIIANIDTTISIEATDPAAADGTAGSGANSYIIFNYSQPKIVPLLSTDINATTNLKFDNYGLNIIDFQIIDAAGNISPTMSYSFEVKAQYQNGSILINHGDQFTNYQRVTLDIRPEPELPPANSTRPLFYRLANDDEEFPDQWREYPLLEATFASIPWEVSPGYGEKRVSIEYLMPDGNKYGVLTDEIIYAPYYGVEYYDSQNQAATTISNFPPELVSQSQVPITLDLENTGSYIWHNRDTATLNPVMLSYRWISVDKEGDTVNALRGNSTNVGSFVEHREIVRDIELMIDTPLYPGDYRLEIDLIHEGESWFSDFPQNDPLVFTVNIKQNPNLPDINQAEVINDMDHQHSIGSRTATFTGLWEVARDPSRGDYMIKGYGFDPHFKYISKGEEMLGKEVTVTVKYNAEGTAFEVQDYYVEPKVNRGSLFSTNNREIRIYQDSELDQVIKYSNTGEVLWYDDDVYLELIKQPVDYDDLFDLNPWLQTGRIPMTTRMASNGSEASFGYRIITDDSTTTGRREFCWQINDIQSDTDPNRWEVQDTVCHSILVLPNQTTEQEQACTSPLPYYEKLGLNKLGELTTGNRVVAVENIGNWYNIYLPTGGHELVWVMDTDNCLQDIQTISNPIPATENQTINIPSGSDGVVIATDGLQLRYGPGEEFSFLGTATHDSMVEVIAMTTRSDDHTKWIKVRLNDGREGWVPMGQVNFYHNPTEIKFSNTPEYRSAHICTSELEVMYNPVKTSPIKTTVYQNHNFNIIQEYNNWYLIYTDRKGNTGWVDGLDGICEGHYYPKPSATGNVLGDSVYMGVDYQFPTTGHTILSGGKFGASRGNRTHVGLDLSYRTTDQHRRTKDCNQPVYAAASGRVVRVVDNHREGGYSSSGSTNNYFLSKTNEIYIDHPNGSRTIYVHLAPNSAAVKNGQYVQRGQRIANIGLTGLTTGCHLHFEVWRDSGNRWSAIDPLLVLGNRSSNHSADGNLGNAIDKINLLESQQLRNWESYTDSRGRVKEWHQCDGYYLKQYQKAAVRSGNNISSGGAIVYDSKNNNIQIVANGMWQTYKELGGPCGHMGAPRPFQGHITERPAHPSRWGTSGAFQRFTNGTIYWNNKTWDGHGVHGSISKVYERSGGTYGSYGFPVSDRTYISKFDDYCQRFEGGYICEKQSDAWHTVYRRESKWNNYRPSSNDLVQICGSHKYYARKYYQIEHHGLSLLVYNSEKKQSYIVSGDTLNYYMRNCENLRRPMTDTKRTGGNDGWYQHFERGNVYWSDHNYRSQPGVVRGAIRDYYESQLQGTRSYLGYPEGHESSITSKCGNPGTMQRFNHGTVYHSEYGNVDIAYNDWWNHYANNHGEMHGEFGWPTSKVKWVGSNEYWYFEAGKMKGARTFLHWYIEDNILGCWGNSSDSNTHESRLDGYADITSSETGRFERYTRAEGTAGDISEYTCGTQTYTAVRYSYATRRSGETIRDFYLIRTSPGVTYEVAGPIGRILLDPFLCDDYGPLTPHSGIEFQPQWDEGRYDYQFLAGQFIQRNRDTGEWLTIEDSCYVNAYFDNEAFDGQIGPASYLGVIERERQYYPRVVINGQKIRNVYAQEFSGGYIVDDGNNSCEVILNNTGINRANPRTVDLEALAESFIQGLQDGIKDLFVFEALEVAEALISFAATKLTGPIAVVLTGVKLVLTAVQIFIAVQSLVELVQLVTEVIQVGDLSIVAYLAGMILVPMLSELILGIGGKDIDDVVKKSNKSMKKLANLFRDLELDFGPVLNSSLLAYVTKKGIDGDMDAAERLGDVMENINRKSLDLEKMIDGKLDKADNADIAKAAAAASKTSEKVDLNNPMFKRFGSVDEVMDLPDHTVDIAMDYGKRDLPVEDDILDKIKRLPASLRNVFDSLTDNEVKLVVDDIDRYENYDFDRLATDRAKFGDRLSIIESRELQEIDALNLSEKIHERVQHVMIGHPDKPKRLKSGAHDFDTTIARLMRGDIKFFAKGKTKGTRDIELEYDSNASFIDNFDRFEKKLNESTTGDHVTYIKKGSDNTSWDVITQRFGKDGARAPKSIFPSDITPDISNNIRKRFINEARDINWDTNSELLNYMPRNDEMKYVEYGGKYYLGYQTKSGESPGSWFPSPEKIIE